MKKIINKFLVNHSLIYKLFLYVGTLILVVYLLPKGGQFKYEFQKGKPWQYENMYAPFDFAIQKSEDEIAAEKTKIQESSRHFFEFNEALVLEVKNAVSDHVSAYLSSEELSQTERDRLRLVSNEIVEGIYEFGYLETSSQQQVGQAILSVRRGNRVQDIQPHQLFTSSRILAYIKAKIGDQPFTESENAIIDILYKELLPNVYYDEELSKKVLEENLSKVSYTKGLVTENERIIFKGDIVEGEKLAMLISLKNEFESQVWSESNYNWIVFGYTILVALAFLMLLLFLRKYRIEIFENNNKVTFIFFNMILIVLLITLIVKYDAKYVYVAPIVILPLVLKAFFDARLGMFSHVLTVLLLGFIVPNSFEFIFLQIIAGIVTILTISELYKRANLFISVLQITLVYFVAYFAFSIIQEGNAQNLDWEKFVYFALNGAATLFFTTFTRVRLPITWSRSLMAPIRRISSRTLE